jgi:uracil-DNA glycosylase
MLPAHPHEAHLALLSVHAALRACRRCPRMEGRAVHGPPVLSSVLLVGQAPGAHEGELGRPFAWTAGRTLFRWFHEALGASEEAVRERVYFSAVARCFPGKAKGGGGDRKPDPQEVEACRPHLAGEVAALCPRLVLPVGALAISQVLGHRGPLAEVVGTQARVRYLGAEVDVIALPHPSGASTWHRSEPGLTLLRRALALLAAHPEAQRLFPR